MTPAHPHDHSLARSERVYRLALEASGSLGYEWHVESGHIEWFGDIERVLGLSPAVLPRTLAGWKAVIHPDDHDEVMSALMTAVQAHRPFELQYRVVRGDGQVRHWREHGSVLEEIGSSTVIVGACTDVTEQLLVEEQLRQSQKLEAVGLLAGGIAHDFNNLLSVIQGYGELLRDELNSNEQRAELLDEVLHASRRASTLTRQLLTFSRRQVLQPKNLDVVEVVQEMHDLLRRVIGEDLTLVLCTDADTPHVHADPGQLEQVIMNLAVNARDAMEQGGTVHLSTGRTDKGWAFLEVRDNGSGIEPEVLSRMFEPFYTTKPPGRGTGLGLSTVHGIVMQTGGTVSVKSTPGEGSTFRVELPPASGEAVIVQPISPREAPVVPGQLILVVEDEPVVALLVRRLLQDVGYEVMLTYNITEAMLEIDALERPLDLVITDMIMSGGSGRELADRLAVTHPALPVLFMSGYTADMLSRHGGLSPRMTFLEKPFTQETLARAVRETIARGPTLLA